MNGAQAGRVMTTAAFLDFLEAAKLEIERGASMEGSLRYEWADQPDHLVVAAFVRTGNDMGQGGSLIVHGDVPFPADVFELEQQRQADGG